MKYIYKLYLVENYQLKNEFQNPKLVLVTIQKYSNCNKGQQHNLFIFITKLKCGVLSFGLGFLTQEKYIS